jgi:hypothetical protein
MTSERTEMASRGVAAPRWLKTLVRGLAASSLVAVTTLSVAGGFGCAEETFKCCECAFQCSDAMGAEATFYMCDCPQGDTYTYEECGILCKVQMTPEELNVRASAAGLSNCMLPPKQNSVLAKNSCSPGWPVGEPP